MLGYLTFFPDLLNCQVKNAFGDEVELFDSTIDTARIKQFVIKSSERLKFDPNNLHYLELRATSNYIIGNYSNAIKDLKKSISIDSSDWRIYELYGRICYDIKKYFEAINQYSKGLNINSNSGTLYHSRAMSYYEIGEFDNAISDYTNALSNNKSPMSLNNRGLSYLAVKKYDKAIVDFKEAIILNPSEDLYYANLGYAYHLSNDNELAEEFLNKSIEINPQNGFANYFLALHFKKKGDDLKFRHYLQEAKKYGITNDIIKNFK
ncbi:MAG: hypothetical protein CL663_07930 [Bacteroidetes bacterium]|nr:hypothetical protein [Bacteroidota bacterium]